MAKKNDPERPSARPGDPDLTKERDADEDDTAGHTMLPDPWMNQQLAQSRNTEIERALREQKRGKESRPRRDRR